MIRSLLLLVTLLATTLPAAEFHVYVGDVSPDSVLLAWGTTSGRDTIGRGSPPHGRATVRLGDREVTAENRNWAVIDGLAPDREYSYRIELDGRLIGDGSVRTFPERANKLAFFVIGDFGTGGGKQRELARAMAREFEARRQSDNPVRFVLTTGDNVYGTRWSIYKLATGDSDRRWGSTFFEPYAPMLGHVPFYMTLGNHDGNESESRGDLAQQLDNFFFPGNQPARWYAFSYGGLVEFFALDTTENTLAGPPKPAYEADGEQLVWFRRALAASKAPWKIVYYHNPPYSAGPKHPGRLAALRHIHDLCVEHGVQAVFNGHEHNLQFTDPEQTGGIQYVVTGSGGQLRSGSVPAAELRQNHIAGWAPQVQFCVVEIEGGRMTITPVSTEPVQATGPDGSPAKLPITVAR